MKTKTGKVFYNLLLLVIGLCMIVGGILNIKKDGALFVIVGGFAIGVGMVIFACRGFVKSVRNQ